jgi:BarA-like signal transduction histidine kinase
MCSFKGKNCICARYTIDELNIPGCSITTLDVTYENTISEFPNAVFWFQ